MIHKMKLNPNEFNNVLHNNKVMEVRLNDEKRKNVKVGDTIIFLKRPLLDIDIQVIVKNKYIFNTFREAYAEFSSKKFGYPEKTATDMLNLLYSIYSKEQEKDKGVLVIEFIIDLEKNN